MDEVTTAFTVVENSFKTQEMRWQKCYEDMQRIKDKFDLHDQHFVDCKILMDARQKEANELFKRFDEEVTKLTRNMNDKADFVLTRFVPEALEEFQAKVKNEITIFKEHWLPSAFGRIEAGVADTIGKHTKETLSQNIGKQLESMMMDLQHETRGMLQTASEVTAAEFKNVDDQLSELRDRVSASGSAGGGGQCPCLSGKCPRKCNTEGTMDPLSASLKLQEFDIASPDGASKRPPGDGHDGGGPPGGNPGGMPCDRAGRAVLRA